MRRYITEKVGIVECFQILVAMIAASLGFYALSVDESWNRKVDKEGLNMCIKINQNLESKNASILAQSECNDRLNIKYEESCKAHIAMYYLKMRKPEDIFKVNHGGTFKDMKKFVYINLRRHQVSETSFLAMINVIMGLLMMHVVAASCLEILELRTQWNAMLQGIILFACGFAAMLLAISLNSIDNKYITIANEIQECGVLRFCDRGVTFHPDIHPSTERLIDEVLTALDACQDVKVKQSICIILIIMIGICVILILLAMDLKYEQESEEQEMLEQARSENLDTLAEDQNVVFEGSNPSAPVEDATLVPPPSKNSYNKKSGNEGIAEFLATHGHKHLTQT